MNNSTLGVDIEEVQRFKKLVRNQRFLNRIFTKQEIVYCASKKQKLQHFAVRFAAKEAVWKALSEILKKQKTPLGHWDIGVKNDRSGKPAVVLPSRFKHLEKRIAISLSHTAHYAVAVALVRV